MTCVWDADPACLGTAWSGLDADVQERSLMLATSSLQMLTNYRVGTCPITIRPCPEPLVPCGHFPDYPNAYVGPGPFFPHMEPDGLWYNSCGCQQNCKPLSEVDIPGPVGYIDRLMIDGAEVPTDDGNWRLDNGHLLVWQGAGPSPIPSVQDLNKADTEPGTWSITYSRSYPVARDARMAVAYLAVEFAKACKPKSDCKLPRGVTSVVRNGVSFTIEIGLFPNGLTKIDVVDAFILKWAPAGSPRKSATVLSPRSLRTRRTNAVPQRTQGVFVKDPDAVKDYQKDWAPWLGTDTILTSVWIEESGTITIASDTHTDTTTKVWLSGGVVNTVYTIVNRITTVGGRTSDDTLTVRVREQ